MIAAKTPAETCSAKSVMLLADGELPPSKAVEVEDHLSRCEACRAELELIRSMRKSLRSSCSRRAPQDMAGRIRRSLGGAEGSTGAAAQGGTGRTNHSSESPDEGESDRPSGASFAKDVAHGPKGRAHALLAVEGGGAERGGRGRKAAWLVAGVVVAAACWAVVVLWKKEAPEAANASAPAARDGGSIEAFLDELVTFHANPLPPEESDVEALTRFEPYVGVPVRRSALTLLRGGRSGGAGARLSSLEGATARRDPGALGEGAIDRSAPVGRGALEKGHIGFDGARIHTIRVAGMGNNAAALHYKVEGRRITVYVFNPVGIQLGKSKLRTRVVEENPVYVGNMRGYSVAATERGGVGYALLSDLDEDQNLQMVASF